MHPPKSWIKSVGVWGLLALGLWYLFSLPDPLFDAPWSYVLTDREGRLLGARVAEDGQWRFPPSESLPPRFVTCLLAFEDRRFWRHPGFDPLALGRAALQNLRAGRVVSGGSTLTMQVIRLSLKPRSRSLWQKLYEIVLATRLELQRSKEEILRLYAAHAPFGGNVVGLEAAAWRYFGKAPHLLSWAEAATLAVLPNQPGLIHPGRNRQRLLQKRNRLLERLLEQNQLDSTSYRLALEEPLPERLHPLPRLAPHLLDYLVQTEQGRRRFHSSLEGDLQAAALQVAQRHERRLNANGIHNLAFLILDLPSGEVLAYVGNAPDAGNEHQGWVDVVQAPRSSGSILKPFLFARALDAGRILPASLLPDVPSDLSGYHPENFHESFDGAVRADEALVRSLNVPFVHLLRDYGLERFHRDLRRLGFKSLRFPARHYGLTLILGGGEVTLWELAGAYTYLGEVLQHYHRAPGEHRQGAFLPPKLLIDSSMKGEIARAPQPPQISPSAAWLTLHTMEKLERPDEALNWETFPTTRRVAWKTGTSFGFRDAWAVGLTPRHLVAVWVGNADGEGRPGLVGVRAAAPLLFDLFELLPPEEGGWFEPPWDELHPQPICAQSGFLPTPICPVDTVWAPPAAERAPACPYHTELLLDQSGRYRVFAQCYPLEQARKESWFILPPLMAWFYRPGHPGYRGLPPIWKDCLQNGLGADNPPMSLIYPQTHTRILLPMDFSGEPTQLVLKAAHQDPHAKIFWHLDDVFLGTTQNFHHMACSPAEGTHRLVLVDERGYRLEKTFEVIRSR